VSAALIASVGSAVLSVPAASAVGDASACGLHGSFSQSDGIDLCTYQSTGAPDTFTTPAGVSRLFITLLGAGGRIIDPQHPSLGRCGGDGGETSGQLVPSAGEVLQVNVGGQAPCDPEGGLDSGTSAGGWNGGGSGGGGTLDEWGGAGGNGATDIRTGNDTLSDRILIAGGGGGRGGNVHAVGTQSDGGAGGGLAGIDGHNGDWSQSGLSGNPDGGAGGGGGNQLGGGATPGSGDSAGFGFGGTGGDYAAWAGGGGGGGGFFGGGGGQGGDFGGGGGGGSGFVSPDFTASGTGINTTGINDEAGEAQIGWDDPIPITLALSPSAAATGSITLAATPTPSTAVGFVDFLIGTTNLGSAQIISGVAQLTTHALPAGTDVITMKYSGDEQHLAGSQQGTIIVGDPPQITTQPQSQTGSAADVLTYTAAASGAPTPTVQWQTSTDNGGTWQDLPGATSTSIGVTGLNPALCSCDFSVADGTQLRAVFTNAIGQATSSGASFYDESKPVVVFNPSSASLLIGGTFGVSARAGANPAATVQWQVSTDGGNTFTDIAGASGPATNGDAYTVQNVTLAMNGNQYRAVYTNALGTAFTTAATLTVRDPFSCYVPNPTSTNYSHCAGADLSNLDLDGIDLDYADLTGADLSSTSLGGTQLEHANLTGANLTGDDFGTADIAGANLSETDVLPQDITLEPLTAAGTPVTWIAPGEGNVSLPSCNPASGSTFAPGATTVTCVIDANGSNPNCAGTCVAHGSFTVTIDQPSAPVLDPTLGNPADVTVPPGATAHFLSIASGMPDPQVKWQTSTDLGQTWTDIAQATSAGYSFTALQSDSGSEFRAVWTNFAGTVTTSAATLTVAVPLRPLRVVPDDQQMNYGATPPSFTAQYQGFLSGDNATNSLTGSLTCDTQPSASSGLDAGTYPIVCGGLTSTKYDIQYAQGTLTVFPDPVKVSASKASMTYGGLLPTPAETDTGFAGSDTFASLGGTCAIDPALTSPPVGDAPGAITCGGITSSDYDVTYVPATLSVTPAPLTITASSASMVYGGAVPAITASISGLVNGDTARALGPALSCSTVATPASDAGHSYGTSCSGAADPNYAITYSPGSVSVTQAPLTVTASSEKSTFGMDPAPITADYSGFVNGQNALSLTSAAACSTTASAASSVGIYPSSCHNAVDGNYAFTYVAGTVTVVPAPLTITASSQTVQYGSAPAPVTVSYTGLANGATAPSTPPTCSTPVTTLTGAGTYASSCSGASDGNYAITYVAGTVTVKPAPLLITASSGSMTYGTAPPTIKASYSGLVNGDTVTKALSKLPTCSTQATSDSNVGTYQSSCANAVSAGNYLVAYTPGTVTITPAPISVTPATISIRRSLWAGKVTFSATVINTPGKKPVAGVTVVFSAKSLTGYVFGCTALTNTLGVATCTNSNVLATALQIPPSYTATASGTNVITKSATGRITLF
jgi:hypothetical protein